MEIQSLGSIRPPEVGGLAYPCLVPVYIWLLYGLAMPAPRPVRGVIFASPQVDRVRSDRRRIKVSTIRQLLSLSCAANSRRILPMFSYKYATGAHRLKEQC